MTFRSARTVSIITTALLISAVMVPQAYAEAPAPAVIPVSVSATAVAPLETPAKQAFLMDVNTGTVLYTKNADSPMPTSSMSKMMTMYVVFQAIKDGRLHLTDELPVSEHAWRQEGSRMFVKVGDKVKVEDLIRGVIVQSGNDAAVVLAEALGSGSEGAFSDMMNDQAQKLGMTNSHFVNANGMPDPHHYSTAHDLGVLAMALIRDFPDDYHYFSEIDFTYNNIKQGNRNPLLYRNMNVDGLKTGHTDVGGYGLTASAVREGHRLVMVLNGLSDMQARADESAHVLDWGFREYGYYPVTKAGDKLATAKVLLGKAPEIALVAEKDLSLILPRNARAGLKSQAAFAPQIQAPIAKGQVLGKLTVTAPGVEPKEVDLLAADDVAELGFFEKLMVRARAMLGRE